MKDINNKGFTLIELIVTIALLAVISIISFVAINGVIEKNKVSNCETLVNNIKVAAKEYVSDNRYKDSFNVSGMNAKTLIDNKYLTSPISNPFNNSSINPEDIKLSIILKSNNTVGNISVMSSDGSVIDCKSGKW